MCVAMSSLLAAADTLEMPLTRRLLPIFLAAAVLLMAVELIRRRKLREEYALLWLGTGVVLLVFAIFPGLLLWLRDVLQIDYRTLAFLACFGLLAMIVMQLSTVASAQSEQIRRLAQEIALLNRRLQDKTQIRGGEKTKTD